ncbi:MULTISPECIES: zinc-dependent alcohol dehydrogenase [unclassified Paenibacillus]|uniref:zinc-dependent alcohol dehydrogenase n=1 Tax=unclassified Paenibacillus TaxID=185978 RepID=UPI001AE41D89|nr:MULTISPECIES: zinc-dependent alcohol dehydrogenase [unclassified Paenibacillus]MBP1155709.1 S-(hydroxymethyl)glutathione dehydrogenase/alcohol dehydrogenase [Paenibacillus sp. PvP091]MBP1168905.1 S-(hydroxymethyl)glutathione dehydrogenase/alcohol dehydrogenase [Paenibacillus sp. PvR098]MBP2439933.1 S-(hydroxymethyl)glutathione dehydrogenase/alcohol dehydrogenase [Paenibacillus sp. PvP052]
MKAVTFQGAKDIQVKEVADPKLHKSDDIIVRITSTAICGSDLHIYQGALPAAKDYVIGHEPMGIVEEVSPGVTRVKKGDRVVLPFNISCGQCFYCHHEMESQCDHSNKDSAIDSGGYFGFTERYGNYPGGQAEYLHVPYGNFMPFVIPESCELPDEALLFMSDVLPTAYWSVENAGVEQGDTVVVLGCGPVGLMTQKFAWMRGAKRVIAIDNVPYRLNHAKKMNNVEIINFDDYNDYDDVGKYIREMTKGGADVVIDCVGMDGKKSTIEAIEQKLKLQGGTLSPIKIALDAVRKFGTIQLTGVYGAKYNMFPLGNIFERNITLKMGQAPVIHYMPMLFEKITAGEFDPTEIITHQVPLERAADVYKIFNDHEEDCIKVVLKP